MEATLRRPLPQLLATYSEEEIAREEEMVMLGRDQVRKQIAKAKQHGNESGTIYGQPPIARSITKLSDVILRFVDKAKTGGAGRRHICTDVCLVVEVTHGQCLVPSQGG